MPKPFKILRFVVALSPFAALPAAAEPLFDRPMLGTLPGPIQNWLDNVQLLPWLGGALAISTFTFVAIHRFRLRRRKMRQDIAGLPNGPRFRVVDAMCHAVWRGAKINDARLHRAHELARDTVEMDYTPEHMREQALRADRLIIPTNFLWMRDGLTKGEKMVIFNATLSVLLADGPLTKHDRRFLKIMARGLGLGRHELRNLGKLIPA